MQGPVGAGDARPVGRAREVDVATRALGSAGSGHLLVSAGPALGRSSFARYVAAATGRPVIRVQADATSRALAFGALAPVVARVDDPLGTGPDALVRAVARLVPDPGCSPPVILVDDAHHLDAHSALAVAQAADAGATLVLTVSRGVDLPPPLAVLRRDGRLTALELRPVDDATVARLAAEVLGGSVEPVLVRSLTRCVGGAPAAVVEVLDAARRGGSVARTGRVWRQVRELPIPDGVVLRAATALEGLDADTLVGLDVIAVAGSIPHDVVEALVGAEPVETLQVLGLVDVARIDGVEHLAPADPVVRSVRLHLMPDARIRRLARAARATRRRLGAVDAGAPTTSSGSTGVAGTLLDAVLALRGGEHLDRDTAVAAVALARNAGESDVAEALCRSVLEHHPDADAAISLGELLTTLGRSTEAERLLAGLTVSEPDHVALVAMTRAVNFAYHLDQVDRALALIADTVASLPGSPWVAELIGLGGVIELFLGRPREALRTVRPYLDPPDGRRFVEAATAAGPALVVTGRHLEAADLAQQALDERIRLGDQPMLSSPGLHALVRSLALAEAGRYGEADDIAGFVLAAAVDIGDRDGQMWAGIIAGRSLLDQGRLDEAMTSFETAASAAIDLNLVPHLRWSRGGAVLAAAQMGDPDATRRALDALDACPPTRLELMGPELLRARAWGAIATGDLRRGGDQLLAAADAAADGDQPGLELLALHDLVRIGRADTVDRLAEVGAGVQGDVPAARVAHGWALRADDGVALGEVADRFEAAGALLLAAESANQASWAHRRAGDGRRAERERARALRLRAARPAAVTPALDLHPGLAALTAREREVAMLAASGTPSKEIARRLSVSVRTVDNLLQRVYRKLGVSGRDALRDARRGDGHAGETPGGTGRRG